MNRLLSIFIFIIGLILIIGLAMNGVLFFTHPDLNFSAANDLQAFNFIAVALFALFLISWINSTQIRNSIDSEQSLTNLVIKHQIVLLNLISSSVLLLFFLINQIDTSFSIFVIIITIISLTIGWLVFISWLHIKKKRSMKLMLPNLVANILFTTITMYLFIELYLYFNLN